MVEYFEQWKKICDETEADPRIRHLMNYVSETWFNSTVWRPRDICAYQRLVRTNNDVEGYHLRLNTKCHDRHPPIYSLIKLLYDEAKLVKFNCKLVSSQTVKVTRRKQTTDHNLYLKMLWDAYDEGSISEEDLLNEASQHTPF